MTNGIVNYGGTTTVTNCAIGDRATVVVNQNDAKDDSEKDTSKDTKK